MYHIFIKDETFMPLSIAFFEFSFDEEPKNVIILMSNNELQFQRIVVVALIFEDTFQFRFSRQQQ